MSIEDNCIKIRSLNFSYISKKNDSEFNLKIDNLDLFKNVNSIALTGKSGSGKSTLGHLIAGIINTNNLKTKIEHGETDINSLSDGLRRDYRIKNIGFIFQNFALINYLNALDNILLPYLINKNILLSSKLHLDDLKTKAVGLAIEFGLNRNLLSRFPNNLSGGEQQRIAISRALITNPKLIIADEATGNLDTENSQIVIKILKDYILKNKCNLLFITHDHGLINNFDKHINLQTILD